MKKNKLKKYLLNLWYGLPFGMKGADTEIMGSKESNGADSTIEQEVSDQRVAKHLLKGEVTQEVEELRYRTYKVSNESENFKYLGNGVTVKEEKKKDKGKNKTRYKFSQENENICKSLSDAFKTDIDKYRLEIEYNDFVRFRVEKFATRINVDIDENKKVIETTLCFSTIPNPDDVASKPFVLELRKLLEAKNDYEIMRNEIATTIKSISFSTYKASNEDDFVSYSFTNGGKFISFNEVNGEYQLKLSWDEYVRLPLDLEAKYYSKSMAEKYEKNERKAVVVPIINAERKRYCSMCGKEMSVYDADIQEADGHEPICKECMEKLMREKDKGK